MPITTNALVERKEDETGLSRSEVLLLAAKSATIRHLASHPAYKERFVLKGGTLLTNVYNSPRQSVADVDFTHDSSDSQELDWPALGKALTINDNGFVLHGDDARQDGSSDDILKSTAQFTIGGVKPGNNDEGLQVTVSLRRGEWLDQRGTVLYTDYLLADNNQFEVQGLSVDELAAEKILAWTSKGLTKHLVDLAFIARETRLGVDPDKVVRLVRKKFQLEEHLPRYTMQGIKKVGDISMHFASARRVKAFNDDWRRFSNDDLVTDSSEKARPDSLTDGQFVLNTATDFWRPALEALRPY